MYRSWRGGGGKEPDSKSYSAGNVGWSGIFGPFSGILTLNFTPFGSHHQFWTLEPP